MEVERMNEEEEFDELQQLTLLIQKSITLFEEDRAIAIKNFDDIEAQLNEALVESEWGYTDGSKLEEAKNKAMEIVIKTGDRLQKAIESLSKIIITNLNNENRLQVANKLTLGVNGERLITEPVSIQDMQKKLTNS